MRGEDDDQRPPEAVLRSMKRREFMKKAAIGTALTALGGAIYVVTDRLTACEYEGVPRDQLPKLPPGQRRIERLKPMGGDPGNPSARDWTLRVHGEVEEPFTLSYEGLLGMEQVEQICDVHCVTGWSVFDVPWVGVRVRDLAERAGVKPTARHLIFEAAHGYTANIPIAEAMKPNVLVAHRLYDAPLIRRHGSPVRSLVPDLYFWKSAKWLTGLRFVERDEPGYWEVRGYHNHGNPWCEERYG